MSNEMNSDRFRRQHVDLVEHNIQKVCILWYDLQPRFKGILLYAIPNGGLRDKATAAKLKAEGVRSGVPDLHLAYASGGYAGLYIETKIRKGKPSDEQLIAHAYLRSQNYQVAIVRNLEEFQHVIIDYFGLPADALLLI